MPILVNNFQQEHEFSQE